MIPKIEIKQVVFVTSAIFISFCSETPETPSNLVVDSAQAALEYNFDYINDEGVSISGITTIDGISALVRTYCDRYMEYRWQVENVSYMPYEFRAYQSAICAADLYERILDPHDSPKIFKENVIEIKDKGTLTFWVNPFVALLGNYVGEGKEILFENFDNIDKRRELSRLILTEYTNMARLVLLMMNDKDLRCKMYRTNGDIFFSDDPEIDSTSYRLLEEAFGSLPNILERIWDTRIAMVNESLEIGESKEDYWTSEDYGAIPALRFLLGNVNFNGENWSSYELPGITLNYPTTISPPQMSGELMDAVRFVTQYAPDFFEIKALDASIGSDGFYNEIKTRLLNNANEYRVNVLNKEPYSYISELYNDYGVSSSMVKSAIDYVYYHLFLFPRLPAEDPESPDVFHLDWGNKYVSVPWFYFTKELIQETNAGLIIGNMEENITSIPNEYGVSNVMSKLKHYAKLALSSGRILDPATECNSDNIDPVRVSAIENKITTYANEVIDAVEDKNGKIEMSLRTSPANVEGTEINISLGVSECHELFDAYGYEADNGNVEIRSYSQYAYNEVDRLAPFACTKYGDTGEYCENYRDDFKEGICTYNAVADQCHCHIDDYPAGKDIVLEYGGRKVAGEGDVLWNSIYVLSSETEERIRGGATDNYAIRIPLDGKVKGIAARILSREEMDIGKTKCVQLNSVEGECLDRDWVPAIDNETIDTTGNQYETSYTHYLDMARIAANQARSLRDDLMNDIITEAHEVKVEQSQEDSAIDGYYNNISEICGYDISVEKETLQAVINDDDSSGSLKERIEELWKLDDPNSVLPGEQRPGEYGCAADGESRFDTVQCAVRRNCSTEEATPLKKILPTHYNELIGFLTAGVIPPEFNNIPSVSMDELFSKAGLSVNIPDPAQDMFYPKVLGEINRIEKMLYDTSVATFSALYNMKIYQWPEEYSWQDYAGDWQNLSQDASESVYGAYFEKLNEIDVMRSDLSSAVKSYLGGFEKARAGLEKVRNAVNILRYQYEYQEGTAAAQAIMQSLSIMTSMNQYETNFTQSWKNCVEGVQRKFKNYDGGPLGNGISDVKEALGQINPMLEKYTMIINESMTALMDKEHFADACRNAASNTISPVFDTPEKVNVVCEHFLTRGSAGEPVWWEDDALDIQPYFHWESIVSGAYTIETKWFADRSKVKPSEPAVHLLCLSSWDAIENYMNHTSYVMTRTWEQLYENNRASINGEDVCISATTGQSERFSPTAWWYNIGNIEAAAGNIWNKLYYGEMMQCDLSFGCRPTTVVNQYGTGVDYNNPTCDGLYTENFDNQLSAQEGLANELDRLLGNLEIANFKPQLDEIKNVMIEAGNGFVVGRNEIESTIKKMVSKIGELSQLEERQIKELDSLVNNLNLNKATAYSSLTEWNERYQYRQDEYKKQLSRAKIAAWTARRAIEFRFGIDLSEETTRSLYGDIPQEWADDIYVAGQSKCGEEISTDATETDTAPQTKLTACLSPEDRIEDYVQKLEDYVASYGNTPGQDWWFHEDDDTGIISLRDHIAINNVDPNSEVKNLLFFSEEADMTEDTFLEKYESIASKFAVPGDPLGQEAELAWPSFWQGNAVLESSTSFTDALGVPSHVHSSHRVNDATAYEDQKEENTAELVRLYTPGDSSETVELYQTVDLNEVEAEARVSRNQMGFAAYMRKAPVETTCPSGETYFSEFGRCGISCDVDDTIPCPHAGQQCVFAGFLDDATDEDAANLSQFMCAWCDADRSCLGQDGTVVQMQMEVEYGGSILSAAKNVPVMRQWSRNHVNTLEDLISEETGDEIGNATVRLTDAQTRNLARVSENIDLNSGWSINTPGELSSLLIESPEGYITARYASLNGVIRTPIKGSIQHTVSVDSGAGYYAASLWLKIVEGSTKEQQTQRVEMRADGVTIASETFVTDSTWKRVEVNGYVESDTATNISVRVFPEDMSYDGENLVAVWGLQIEKGTQATVYIPAGKNQVPSTTVDTDWQTTGVDVGRVSDLRAPDGRMGAGANVFSLVDDDPAVAEYITYQGTTIGTGAHATFSVWMRAGDGAPAEATIYLGSATAVAAQSETLVTLSSDWQRVQVTVDASAVEIGDVTAHIYPAGFDPLGIGRIEIWGPQVELNAMATGYQATGSNITESIVKWEADIGFVGAQLSEIGAFGCDDLGNPVSEGASFQCPVSNPEYTRNTYVRKHYSDRFVVENKTRSPYPMPSELSVHLSDAERTKLFKNQFDKVEANGDEPGYYVFRPFNLDMDRIASGSMGMFGVLAANNFNYRLRTVGVNMVGTDLINCDNSDSPTTCAANNWLVYDLKQMGDVHIRNHHKEKSVRPFKIPTGRIVGGKAWAAEQVIGYPISGAHQSMLGQMQKVSLMGRPLEGSYELKIYDTPELDWDNVDDIQLILGYHYWTRSE